MAHINRTDNTPYCRHYRLSSTLIVSNAVPDGSQTLNLHTNALDFHFCYVLKNLLIITSVRSLYLVKQCRIAVVKIGKSEIKCVLAADLERLLKVKTMRRPSYSLKIRVVYVCCAVGGIGLLYSISLMAVDHNPCLPDINRLSQ